MPTTNNNKPVDMKQLWQQMEPAYVTSSALSALTTSEDGSDRFIYYLAASTFFRYDCYGNTWQKVAVPAIAPATVAALRYSKYSGSFGRVISRPSSTTLRIPGLSAGVFLDKTIRIIAGAGAGQERTITAHPEAVKYDQGVATVATTSTIGDGTKRWNINQWSGYQVRLTNSTGQTQVRKILYNDATTLTVFDTNYQPKASFENVLFVPSPIITAGSQTHFVIEATDITVNTAWTVAPDYTSRFKIESGGIWLLTSAANAPFANIQYYDVVADLWVNKTVPTNYFLAAVATDVTIERTGEIGGTYVSGTATAGGSYTLTDSAKTWAFNEFKNYRVRITGGTGVGQSRRILGNQVSVMEVARKWDVTPDATSTYDIIADKDKVYIAGAAQSFLLQYDVDADLIVSGAKYDDGIACNLAAMHLGIEQSPVGITSGTRATGGITDLNSTPTLGGTNYLVGDVLTISTGGSLGKAIVTAVSPGGIVTSVALMRAGSGYTTGAAKGTTGGTGTGCTLNITTIGVVCNVVTAIAHNFRIGEQVALSGDAAYAGTVTIIGSDSVTGFDFATAAAGNMSAANTNSATVIVDSTKNWTANEHVGKLLQTHLAGVTGAVQPRIITANTPTTLTVATITTALVNGTGRYAIMDLAAFGSDNQYKAPEKSARGYATGGSTTTLQDTAKNWIVNQWAGARIRIVSGTGRDAYFTITSNTPTELTYGIQGFTSDATTQYIIQDSFGSATGGSTTTIVDTTKSWVVNQWAGKRVRLMGGTGFGLTASANEIAVVSNTATTLTFTAIAGLAPDATTCYAVVGIPPRGAGIQLLWAFGGASAGRYIYVFRGSGSNTFDRYNIATESWELSNYMCPQTDLFTTGSAYAYDGENRIYLSPGVATGLVQHVYYLDLTSNKVFGFGAIPNTQLAPVVGNRMEIVKSPAGIDYLYHLRNTGTEMYRAMIWF